MCNIFFCCFFLNEFSGCCARRAIIYWSDQLLQWFVRTMEKSEVSAVVKSRMLPKKKKCRKMQEMEPVFRECCLTCFVWCRQFKWDRSNIACSANIWETVLIMQGWKCSKSEDKYLTRSKNDNWGNIYFCKTEWNNSSRNFIQQIDM